GAAVGAGAVEGQRAIREAGADLAPGVHRRARLPDRAQLLDGEAFDEVVARIRDDGDAVVGDGELDEVVAAGRLAGLDGAGGVADVGFAAEELGEAAAGPARAVGDADAGVGAEELRGHGLGGRR